MDSSEDQSQAFLRMGIPFECNKSLVQLIQVLVAFDEKVLNDAVHLTGHASAPQETSGLSPYQSDEFPGYPERYTANIRWTKLPANRNQNGRGYPKSDCFGGSGC